MTEQEYMRRAIELARRGAGWTSPNPLVGAVIVHDGRIIGEGWHEKCGGPHAERNALAHLTESAAGATICVTLEPCCHHGRQPPCTDAILEHGLARVVIGSRDPNPLVAGKGAAILRAHGVEVVEDFLRDECDALNPIFFHYITTRRPYVTMKYAMTADGKIATATGASKWITGERARAHVQTLRHRHRAILAGIGTVLADDPLLNCRMEGGRQPVRVVCDSRLRLPLNSQLVRTARDFPTLAVCAQADPAKRAALEQAGVEVLELPGADGRVDLSALLDALGAREIDSILVEGGAAIHGALLTAGLVDHVCCYLAPKLFGGEAAKSPVGGPGVAVPADALALGAPQITRLGGDLLLEYDVQKGEPPCSPAL